MSCNLFYGIICAKKYINLSVVRVVKCCGPQIYKYSCCGHCGVDSCGQWNVVLCSNKINTIPDKSQFLHSKINISSE